MNPVLTRSSQLLTILTKSVREYSKTMAEEHLKTIFRAAVASVEPRTLVQRSVSLRNHTLCVNGSRYVLTKPVYVIGFGKAVLGMAVALETMLGSDLQAGIVIVPAGIFERFERPQRDSKISYVEGARDNLPDESSERGALSIKNLVEKLDADDVLLVLISGGGSALLPLPKPPITLSEKLELIKNLANRGANIVELNCVRKRISVLKGGGLAELAHPARVISLILSDIIGDPLDFIASGPTAVNCDGPDAAIKIMRKYSLYDQIPSSIKKVLEVAKVSNWQYIHVDNYVIGNNKIAALAALEQAKLLGYQTAILSTSISGEVSEVSKIYAELASEVSALISDSGDKRGLKLLLGKLKVDCNLLDEIDFGKGLCLIAAGEPTVIVTGTGRGGRNQQLALSFSLELNKFNLKSANIAFLSCGTDGMDGPTDAAGAIASSDLVNSASSLNIDPNLFLANNDSYTFYSRYKSGANLVITGHTGTNVMDVHVLIISPNKCAS